MYADELINWFSYHPPRTPEVGNKHSEVRAECLALGKFILINTPDCEEQIEALKKLREVMFWANAAIACNS